MELALGNRPGASWRCPPRARAGPPGTDAVLPRSVHTTVSLALYPALGKVPARWSILSG